MVEVIILLNEKCFICCHVLSVVRKYISVHVLIDEYLSTCFDMTVSETEYPSARRGGQSINIY